MAALARYKVVVLDEVPERSVESDLVLTCVKQLMLRNSNIRLVLMSAQQISGGMKTILLSLAERTNLRGLLSQTWLVLFRAGCFKQKSSILRMWLSNSNPSHVAVLDDMRREPSAAVQKTDVGAATLNLIRDLIAHFHEMSHYIKECACVPTNLQNNSAYF